MAKLFPFPKNPPSRGSRPFPTRTEQAIAWKMGEKIYEGFTEGGVDLNDLRMRPEYQRCALGQPFPRVGILNAAILAHHYEFEPGQFKLLLEHFQSAQFQEITPEFLDAVRRKMGLEKIANPPLAVFE